MVIIHISIVMDLSSSPLLGTSRDVTSSKNRQAAAIATTTSLTGTTTGGFSQAADVGFHTLRAKIEGI